MQEMARLSAKGVYPIRLPMGRIGFKALEILQRWPSVLRVCSLLRYDEGLQLRAGGTADTAVVALVERQ